MSLIDNSNGSDNGPDDAAERFSLLEFDAPTRRLCTSDHCDQWAVTGTERCAKHPLVTRTAAQRANNAPVAQPITTKAIAQGMAVARTQVADEEARIVADAQASLAQQHADEEAEADALEAEIAAEHAAATAQPARQALTPEGCEVWGAFWFGQNPVYARTYTDGSLLLVAGIDRAEMVYKAQAGAKVYQCNPGRLRTRQAAPVLRTFQVPAEAPAPVAAPVKAAPRVTAPTPIATRQPLVTAPVAAQMQTDGGTLEGALGAISNAHRPPPGLVNGYILPEDVNPVAGYYEPVIAKKGEPTRYQDERLHAAAQISAERVRDVKRSLGMTVRAPQVTHRATPRAVDASVPEPLRAGINAARARTTPLTAAQRATLEKAQADLRARISLDTAITVALKDATGEYKHGCLAAWDAAGDRRYATIATAAAEAGVLPPKERSLRAIASDAVKAIQGGGLKVAVVTRGSEWSVYRPAATAEVGASVGEARVTAKLDGEQLVLAGPDDLCAVVRAAFKASQDEAILGSTEISTWLAGLCTEYRAVRVVYGRWLAPGLPTEMWKRLAPALRKAGLPVPSRPAAVSSVADVTEEIRDGLIREIGVELNRIEEARSRDNYGDRAATNALTDLEALTDKAKMYTAIVGPKALDTQLAAIAKLRGELEASLSDTAQRGAMLEMD